MSDTALKVIWTSLLLGVVSGIVSLLLTRLLLWLLPKWGMVDKPDFARHIHTRIVPRGGGLGMLISFVSVSALCFGLVDIADGDAADTMLKILLPLGILMPLGIIDDRLGLRARTKFIFQILASALAWGVGFRMDRFFGLSLPVWLGFTLTIIWITGFINAFNMIDGVDGLAAGIGFISSTCMVVIAMINGQPPLAILLFIFACSLLGFLYYNWHPARLFMGDTGSMFIGYVLAVAGLCLNAQTISVASIGLPLLACGIPIIDIFLAIWRRVIGSPSPDASALESPVSLYNTPYNETSDAHPQSEASDSTPPQIESLPKRIAHLLARLGTADQSHIHHRLLRHFQNNQRKTTLNIYGMALCLSVAGIACCLLPSSSLLPALAIILGTFSFILNRLAFIELWRTTEIAYGGFQSARTGLIISYVINPLWDLACIVVAYLVATLSNPIGTANLLRYAAILMFILCLSRPYRVFWNFAVSDDYFRLIRTLVLGFLIAWASDLLISHTGTGMLHAFAATTAISAIVLERLGIHYIRNWQARSSGCSDLNNAKAEHSLIVGITPLTRFYRNRVLSNIEQAGHEQIVGILAQDKRFLHSYCFGMKVIGIIEDAERLIPESGATRVVVTSPLPEEFKKRLQTICLDNGIGLFSFYAVEEPVCLPASVNKKE